MKISRFSKACIFFVISKKRIHSVKSGKFLKMPKRSLRRISFPVHLSHILRDKWNIVIRDAGWRVISAHGMRLIKTKIETDEY